MYYRCSKCGRYFDRGRSTVRRHRCMSCIQSGPPDLVIHCGDFHAELHTELIPQKKLKTFFSAYRKKLARIKKSKTQQAINK